MDAEGVVLRRVQEKTGALGYKKAFHFITKVQFKIQINLFLRLGSKNHSIKKLKIPI